MNTKNAFRTVGAFGVIFLCIALSSSRYETIHTFQLQGHTIRLEKRLDEPFDYFLARWRAPRGNWSKVQFIGNSLVHSPPFSIGEVSNGVWQIRDSKGEALEEFGPGVLKE